jgi:hypothetical protein
VKGGKSPHIDLKSVPNHDNHHSETMKIPLENKIAAPMEGSLCVPKRERRTMAEKH